MKLHKGLRKYFLPTRRIQKSRNVTCSSCCSQLLSSVLLCHVCLSYIISLCFCEELFELIYTYLVVIASFVYFVCVARVVSLLFSFSWWSVFCLRPLLTLPLSWSKHRNVLCSDFILFYFSYNSCKVTMCTGPVRVIILYSCIRSIYETRLLHILPVVIESPHASPDCLQVSIRVIIL